MYLSKSLELSNSFAADGQNLATIVIKKLGKDRTIDQFELLWEDIMKKKKSLDAGDPFSLKFPKSLMYLKVLIFLQS